MSELHIRQIRATLEKQFRSRICLADVADKPQKEQEDAFLTRAQMALVLAYLTGKQPSDVATAIVDGYQDNGIDAVYFSAKERILYVGQSKWRHNGTGSIDRGDAQKFIKGFRDLINARWERFNEKLRNQSTEIEDALNDASTSVALIVTYTGQAGLSPDVTQDFQDLLDEINDSSQLLTLQSLRQSDLYSIVSQGIDGAPIDIELAVYDWGQVRDPYPAYYGQVSTSDVAKWYTDHHNHLFTPNIRMFLGATPVNSTILQSLLDSPKDFWYYNNGITALCRSVRKKPIGGNTRDTGVFECSDFRIVNGAQTVGAIASAALKNPAVVADARVSIRIVSLENTPPDFDRRVTRFNNTQNRIDRRDFVALDPEQERIRSELLLEGIIYAYKSGEVLTPSAKGFNLDEATVARACMQTDVSLAVQAKREIGKLWDDIEKAPYRILFNGSITGPALWTAVQIVRDVEATLTAWRTGSQGREKLLAIHGNRFISHLVFQLLSGAPGRDPLAYSNSDKSDVRAFTEQSFRETLRVLNADFADSYLATLFKNATKCAQVKATATTPR